MAVERVTDGCDDKSKETKPVPKQKQTASAQHRKRRRVTSSRQKKQLRKSWANHRGVKLLSSQKVVKRVHLLCIYSASPFFTRDTTTARPNCMCATNTFTDTYRASGNCRGVKKNCIGDSCAQRKELLTFLRAGCGTNVSTAAAGPDRDRKASSQEGAHTWHLAKTCYLILHLQLSSPTWKIRAPGFPLSNSGHFAGHVKRCM